MEVEQRASTFTAYPNICSYAVKSDNQILCSKTVTELQRSTGILRHYTIRYINGKHPTAFPEADGLLGAVNARRNVTIIHCGKFGFLFCNAD
jgi:hypothetical protein